MTERVRVLQEHTFAAIGKNMAVTGGGTAFIGGLAASDVAAIGGLIAAMIGLGIQWYYKRRADRREAELHAAQMADLRRDG